MMKELRAYHNTSATLF